MHMTNKCIFCITREIKIASGVQLKAFKKGKCNILSPKIIRIKRYELDKSELGKEENLNCEMQTCNGKKSQNYAIKMCSYIHEKYAKKCYWSIDLCSFDAGLLN